jgi:hypothetical protein
MAIRQDEATQLRHVEVDLLRKYAELPKEVVCGEVARATELFRSARVRTYVPVLVQKQVQDALRQRQGTP